MWGARNVYSVMVSNSAARYRRLHAASLRLMLDELDCFEVLNLVERHVGLPLELLVHAGVSVLMPVLNEEDVAVHSVRTLIQNYSGRHGRLEVRINRKIFFRRARSKVVEGVRGWFWYNTIANAVLRQLRKFFNS